jgi:hypothetical protein
MAFRCMHSADCDAYVIIAFVFGTYWVRRAATIVEMLRAKLQRTFQSDAADDLTASDIAYCGLWDSRQA